MGSKMVRWQRRLMFRFCTKTTIMVRWPVGAIIIDHDHAKWDSSLGSQRQEIYSADPNDHYRPWMEEHVGRQGWDWNWGMANRDATDNRLTIKFRRKYRECAVIAKMMWS